METNYFIKIKQLFLDVLKKSIICKACVRIENSKMIPSNLGDDLNYTFLPQIFNKPISLYDYSFIAHKFNTSNYLFIGSTIEMLADSNTIVWGAGCISSESKIPHSKKVLAVRGPLTRKRLLDAGIECPAVYGDPALLLPLFYTPTKKKKYKIGIIPHYLDINTPFIEKLKTFTHEHLVIDMANYSSYQNIIEKICSCEIILSSSLHGLIIAEAYGIPNIWIKCSDNIMGGNFKFHDFFCSINRDRKKPYLSQDINNINDITDIISHWESGEINLSQLIESAPFQIKKS